MSFRLYPLNGSHIHYHINGSLYPLSYKHHINIKQKSYPLSYKHHINGSLYPLNGSQAQMVGAFTQPGP